MKGYIKVEMILEVESGDLENFQVEDWVIDELNETKIHKDIKIVDIVTDALQFDKGIEDGFEDLF